MEYCILSSEYADELTRLVNDKIRDGWTPQGGVSVHTFHDTGTSIIYFRYHQAMTRPKIMRWTVTTTPRDAEPNVISLNEAVKVDFR